MCAVEEGLGVSLGLLCGVTVPLARVFSPAVKSSLRTLLPL